MQNKYSTEFKESIVRKMMLANLATFKEKRQEDHQQHCTKLEKILSGNL